MTRYVQLNDIHTSDKPPIYRTDSYGLDIFDKLSWAFKYAADAKVDFILFTGDLFHQTQANRVSHTLVNRWLTLFDSFKIPILIVPGNHDLAAGRIESLGNQPIGTLGLHPRVVLFTNADRLSICGTEVLGIPWSYNLETDAFYIQNLVSRHADVLALHAPITPEPNEFFDTIGREDLSGLARIISYGHIHAPEPPTVVKDTLFVNPGAVARRCLGGSHIQAEDQNRTPMLALVEIDSRGVDATYVEIPHKSSSEVYRFDRHDIAQSENQAVSNFVKNLGQASLEAVTSESIVAEAIKLTDDLKVRSILHELLMQG